MEAHRQEADDAAPAQPTAGAEPQQTTEPSPQQTGGADDRPRIGRGTALLCLVGALALLGLGIVLYGRLAPQVDILAVELAGAGAPCSCCSCSAGSWTRPPSASIPSTGDGWPARSRRGG